MICPECRSSNIGVIRTYSSESLPHVWRRRECKDCKHRWTTTETGGKLILSNKAVIALNEKIAGHIVPIYETDHNMKPIRRQDKLICRGRIIHLQSPPASIRVQCSRSIDVKTEHGYLCLIKVAMASPNHKDKIGQELIFNIANEDIEHILVPK